LIDKGLYYGKVSNPMTLGVCSRSGDVLEPMLKPQVWCALGLDILPFIPKQYVHALK
jgi:hypothetical protein